MIITVGQQKLRKAVGILERVAGRHLALPILQNIILKTDHGRLRLAATNLEIGINCWIGAKVEEEGELALPARVLSEFVNNIQDEKVLISTKENIATINAENFKTQIIGFSAKEFPIIPKTQNEPSLTLPAATWMDLFTSVIDAVSLSDARPELAGVFLSFTDKTIETAATDSFRLATRSLGRKNTPRKLEKEFENGLIIPRATVQELIRLLPDVEGELNMIVGDNQIFFTGHDVQVVSRLIDGRYPEFRRVIPEKTESVLIVKKNELEKNIKLGSIFSSSVSDIKIHADKDSLYILAQNSARGEINAKMKAELSGEVFRVAVNYRYLLDGLKTINTPEVQMEYAGNNGPLVLKPKTSNGLIYLIMPLRS